MVEATVSHRFVLPPVCGTFRPLPAHCEIFPEVSQTEVSQTEVSQTEASQTKYNPTKVNQTEVNIMSPSEPTSPSASARLTASSEKTHAWQQGQLLELTIDDLNHTGEGVGRWQGRVVFVPNTVPGDRVRVRLVRVKPQYAYGKLDRILAASPHRVRPSCIVADKCGGCQWQQVDYPYQLETKRNLIVHNLEHIGGFNRAAVEAITDAVLATAPLSYRNKATYPIKATASQVQAGYYQRGSHQLINLNQCPIQDSRLNPFLAEIKQDIQAQKWRIYDEATHQGEVRHLALRIGHHTGEMLLTLVARSDNLPRLETQAQQWMQRYSSLVGICLNLQPDRTNAIFGAKTRCVVGRIDLRERFAGLEFRIQPATFFQVNTESAEALLSVIQKELRLQGHEVLVDAYCGIGTMTLPLARLVQKAIGIEVQPESIQQARQNAELNQISNVTFHTGTTEEWLPQLSQADIVLLDPPRKGCDSSVIQSLIQLHPQKIVYISCNPATLARDLKLLSSNYQVERVQPADFFPQTTHVECAAFLTRLE